MLFKRFDVDVNWVQIDDDVIPRPSYISAGQWIEFWENAASEKNYQMGLDDASQNYREELSDLEAENGRLEDENNKLNREVLEAEEEANDQCNRADKEYERGYKDGLEEAKFGE